MIAEIILQKTFLKTICKTSNVLLMVLQLMMIQMRTLINPRQQIRPWRSICLWIFLLTAFFYYKDFCKKNC